MPVEPEALSQRTPGRCAGEARVHGGEVLAWCGERARHHVLYDDGEDEWLDLAAERLVWHAPRGAPPVAAGLPDGAGLRVRGHVHKACFGSSVCCRLALPVALRPCKEPLSLQLES